VVVIPRAASRLGGTVLATFKVVRLVAVGGHSFPVAGQRAWNNLPETVRSASSLKRRSNDG